jgi:hypothetical protein
MKHTYIFPSILIALDVLSAIVNSDGCRYRLRHPPEDEMNMVKAARQLRPTALCSIWRFYSPSSSRSCSPSDKGEFSGKKTARGIPDWKKGRYE